MIDRSLRSLSLVALVVIATLASASVASAGTVFWMAPQSNTTFDDQVVNLLAPRADLVILRANLEVDNPDYSLSKVIRRFKKAGSMPVLVYGFPNRHSVGGRSESQIMHSMDPGTPLAETEEEGNGRVRFLDVANAQVRARLVKQFAAAKRSLGADGFALDLSIRTPSRWPAPLARQCERAHDFCQRYATGMDAVFAELRSGLGADTYLAYNGLFNNAPGQLADQILLSKHTNAVAVEFFGLDPKAKSHAFKRDILPYLQVIPTLPNGKQVLVFGRAPWTYSSYLEDYEWQRYLYASFLLAARENDLFKYHATFQVPTYKGRTGGLDVYADWEVDLGNAAGPMTLREGLYRREFTHGLVAVAADDGPGGAIKLSRKMYTPEGQPRQGRIRIVPGTALILLDSMPSRRPEQLAIGASAMAQWNWPDTSLQVRAGRNLLSIAPKPPEVPGEYDVLLDWERSLTPYTRLELVAAPAAGSKVVVVAEVDDRQKRIQYALVDIAANRGPEEGRLRSGTPIYFRTRTPKAVDETWPVASLVWAGDAENIVLDGPKVFEGTSLRFRRWSHLRLVGPVDIASIGLSRAAPPAELPGER